jgi:hypothetical protein
MQYPWNVVELPRCYGQALRTFRPMSVTKYRWLYGSVACVPWSDWWSFPARELLLIQNCPNMVACEVGQHLYSKGQCVQFHWPGRVKRRSFEKAALHNLEVSRVRTNQFVANRTVCYSERIEVSVRHVNANIVPLSTVPPPDLRHCGKGSVKSGRLWTQVSLWHSKVAKQ